MRPRLVAALLPVLLLVGPLLPASASAPRISGIDTAKYQHDNGASVDWDAVHRSGQTFAFIKATGHADRVDPWFARDWDAAGKAGMIRGAYHYADPSGSPVAQADAVVNTVGSTREAGDLGIVLDLETTGGQSPSGLARWAHAFLDHVEARTGRVPILYTYVSFWSNAMSNSREFGAYPLWLARYGPEPKPVAGWDRWTFWQRSSSGRVPGISGAVDEDVMCCSAGTLAALADGRSGPITALWHQLGGASGSLGLPLGPESSIPGGWGQTFERGYIASTDHGTWAVNDPILTAYRRAGGPNGSLGVPTGAVTAPLQGVLTQQFTGGTIVWSAVTGAQPLQGVMLARWNKDGGVRSEEGLPRGPRDGVTQQFRFGGLYATKTGVHLVPGALRDTYEELGGASSPLGLPAGEASTVLGGRLMSFDLGALLEETVAGQTVVV